MKVTKQEHACLVVEKAGSTLIIDPGSWTMPFDDKYDVVAVVITHEHHDHWSPEQLTRILDRNPEARILGPAGVAAAAKDFKVETIKHGDTVTVEPFELAFFGEKHALMHESIPVIDNTGVLVDGELYHPGDAYPVPPVPVRTLAVPVGAPWLKLSEVMDYVLEVAPNRALPIHDMTLSTIGKELMHTRLQTATERGGGEFFVLEPGESLEL